MKIDINLMGMAVNTTVGQRFVELITHLGISKNAFAASLDKTATVIQHLVDERNKPGFDLLCRVFDVYPNVSKEWLLQGVGPMLVDTMPAADVPDSGKESPPQAAGVTTSTPLVAPALTGATENEDFVAAAGESSEKNKASFSSKESVAAKPIADEIASVPQAEPLPAKEQPAPDSAWQTALYTQQMAHQMAMAELRNQHLQEQQRLMQQMLDLMQRKL